MRLCNFCNTEKPLDDFPWKNKAKGVKNSRCKMCQSVYAKADYRNRVEYYVTKAAKNNKIQIEKNKQVVYDYLMSHPCLDCGETDVEVLEFDHIIMVGHKAPRVGHYIKHSTDNLLKEIAKCEVRCANCHVRRSRRMQGWSREVMPL